MNYRSLNKGFTLIELLVVISIISLLSSVVLASVRDAREKAQVRAFKAEIISFIQAVELYRLDNNGNPPTSAANFTYTKLNTTETTIPSGLASDFKNKLVNYLPSFPKTNFSGAGFNYYVGTTYKCDNDPTTPFPPYLILIPTTNTKIAEAFQEWRPAYIKTSVFTLYSGMKCLSL